MKGDKSVWASLRARMSSEQDDRLNEVLRLLRLDGERYRRAGLLSHGQKQFLEIGMLLVQEPHLLLLDEPAAGMTDAETEYTAELFRTLAGQHSLMVVEHDMGFVETIADRVTVLHQGRCWRRDRCGRCRPMSRSLKFIWDVKERQCYR